jgi:hypothetical protein
MINEPTLRALSSKALATEDADRPPASQAGSSCAAPEVLSATAHRITVNRPCLFQLSAFPISAFASVTLYNSYGMCYKHQNNPNPTFDGTSMFTISCNKPGDEPVTLRTLP